MVTYTFIGSSNYYTLYITTQWQPTKYVWVETVYTSVSNLVQIVSINIMSTCQSIHTDTKIDVAMDALS